MGNSSGLIEPISFCSFHLSSLLRVLNYCCQFAKTSYEWWYPYLVSIYQHWWANTKISFLLFFPSIKDLLSASVILLLMFMNIFQIPPCIPFWFSWLYLPLQFELFDAMLLMFLIVIVTKIEAFFWSLQFLLRNGIIVHSMDSMVLNEATRHGLLINEIVGTRSVVGNLEGVIFEVTLK